MPISKLRPAFTFTEDRLRELQAVVPEAFADGKINWDTLREALGEALEDETKEHFGLFWPGKREARRLAALPSKGTLIPQPGAGVDEDNTHNLFIEGDNLEVLKLLQKSYAGRVKLIYIDPPYNTGDDRIYLDDYSEPLETYLERMGQVDEVGQLLTTNSRASGRFHSNWLTMIYPRLLLARQLLRDDGIIFVSIDDSEVHNLRQVMNEIFGEGNFVAQLIWQKKTGAGARSKGYIVLHEYVLCYAKYIDPDWDITAPMSDKTKSMYSKRDEYYDTLGPYATWPLDTTSMDERPNLRFPIIHEGAEIWPKKQWLWSKSRVEKAQKDNKLIFNHDKKSGAWNIRFKGYLNDESGEEREGKPTSLLVGSYTQDGTKDFEEMFARDIFPFPKPVEFIKNFLSVDVKSRPEEKELVLDFFCGSATTAQAVLEKNRVGERMRRFIMVQLPEPTPVNSPARQAGFETIAAIGKERIRRVIAKMKAQNTGMMNLNLNEDLGFKSFGLIQSCFSDWQPVTESNIPQLELRFGQAETPLVEGWTPENLLAEILLLQGFPLDSKVRSLPEFNANVVQQVTSEFIVHHLHVCLDKKVKAETVAKINLRPEDILVCLDSALSDEAKVKLADQCNLKVI